MRPKLSIDFGNSYTKVALRANGESRSELLTDASLKMDDLHACVPTVAAHYIEKGKESWHYGTDVMKFREGSPGLTVHRNWKPRFFDSKAESQAPALATAIAATSPRRSFATPPGMTDDVWNTITAVLTSEQAESLYQKLGGHSVDAAAEDLVSEEADFDHKSIGQGFFRWLLEFVDPICLNRVRRSATEIPVRVSLPSFGSVAKAEMLLKEILEDAGWKLDECAPTLPEPFSNAIGAFTEGVNAINVVPSGASPHYGKMFQETGMLARMREALLYDGPKTAWVLIIDVGGYTADFAMVGLHLDEIYSRLEGTIDGKPRLAHNSKALGVSDLDARIAEILPDSKREALEKVIRDPDQQRLESFHRGCFGFLGRHSLGRNLIVGGTVAEKRHIRETLDQFAAEVADAAEDFLSIHQYEHIDDLILTGGGTMIPAVRDALGKRMSHYGVEKVHLHLPKNEAAQFSTPCHPLGSTLVRGATAVGGASVYFDFSDS